MNRSRIGRVVSGTIAVVLLALVTRGVSLSAQGTNDAQSYRLAILYESGETREEAVAKARERAAALNFRLAPVPVR